MKNLITLMMIFGFALTGCEENDNDDHNDHDSSGVEVVTHDIDASGASGFYFNFISGGETDSTGSWHISFQMLPVTGTTYAMPNLVLGGAYVAEYTNISYDDMTSTPDTFMEDYFQDPSVVQYGGVNEVLTYDMDIHKVSVNNPDKTFVLYEPINHTTYKIQFVEYVSGVISFKYDAL